VGLWREQQVTLLPAEGPVKVGSLSELLHAPEPLELLGRLEAASTESVPADRARLLAPIDRQEVWAAGVTYKRSRQARRRESAGAGDFYDRVYDAARPELFFKATPRRVVGPGQNVRIRSDSNWCVPEPELTLVISPAGRIVGYTIGDDVSCRDIEGENPLYLPQAKIFDGCCALGPAITLAESMPPPERVGIWMEIERGGRRVFAGRTEASQMARTPQELADWLLREQSFPDGVFLLTGTGIVPPDGFSLQPGDIIHIGIDGIGTLTTGVERAGRG